MRQNRFLWPVSACVQCLLALAVCTPALTLADCNIPAFVTEHPCLSEKPALQLAGRHTRMRKPPNAPRISAEALTKDALLAVNAGYIGLFNKFPESLRYGMEYRWQALSPLQLRPTAGIIYAENDAS